MSDDTMLARMIPPRFRDVSFDTFIPNTKSQGMALAAVQQWLENLRGGPMLALVGKQGTGKSHLLYSAVREAVRLWVGGTAPFVAPWYRLSDELRYGKSDLIDGGSRFSGPTEVRAKMWERRVALIDEVRPTSGTNFDDTELAKYACYAYDNRIAVLITTNWSPLSAVMGDAAASRFSQVIIDGPDARQEALTGYVAEMQHG